MDFREAFTDLDRACLDLLGEDGELGGQPVRGLFRQGISDPSLGGLGTALHEPLWLMSEEQAQQVQAGVGAMLVVRGEAYRVVRIRRDGLGMVELVLRP